MTLQSGIDYASVVITKQQMRQKLENETGNLSKFNRRTSTIRQKELNSGFDP